MSDEVNMEALLERAQAMQHQLQQAQAEAAEQVVEGQSGGGVVRVRITGGLKLESVSIDPQVVNPADVAMLEDLVVAAANDALSRVQELNQQVLGGLDLGGLGGL